VNRIDAFANYCRRGKENMSTKITVKLIIVVRLALFPMLLIAQNLLASDSNAPAETCGVGIVLAKQPGGFLVTKVLTNSPAALGGSIKQGDLIVAVAQSNSPSVSIANGDSVSDAVALIRGPKGSVVRLTIIPQDSSVSQERVVSLVRGELKGVPFGGIWLSLTNGATTPSIVFQDLKNKRSFKLQDQFGKFIVLEFWATWCAPCLRLMPQTQNEAERFIRRGDVVWLTVSLDESPDIAERRLRMGSWNKTFNVWGGASAAQAFGIQGIPEMFIIGSSGKIVYHGSPLFGDTLDRILR
jgi:thiol-disulfide isomerase/thioredoxin